MKNHLYTLEAMIFRFPLFRYLYRFFSVLMFRALWLFGRIRFAILVTNKGPGCVCAWNSELKYPDNITLGRKVVIGTNVSIGAHAPVTIGDHTRISRHVIIETAGLDFSTHQPPYKHISNDITIGKGVWIGARAMILGGVTIGDYAVIAAGAVVTKSVGAGDSVAGIPARVMPPRKIIES